MRIIHTTVLSFACALAATACTELPEEELGTDEAALVAASAAGEFGPDIATVGGEVELAKSVSLGRRIMLTFGWNLSAMERLECGSLNMQTETITIGDCSYTVQNQDCQTGWSESLNEYVCVCERVVTGASSGDCW